MDTGQLLTVLDLSGVWAFAVSGALTAMQKRMDVFGVLIVAFGTSFGGGTIRDILINRPVFWLHNETYLYILFIATPVAVVFRNYLQYLRKALFFFDTIGLGVYTVIGMQIGLTWGYSPMLGICLGTLTACFGGVVRDLLCNEVPLIFHREIYATICVGLYAYDVPRSAGEHKHARHPVRHHRRTFYRGTLQVVFARAQPERQHASRLNTNGKHGRNAFLPFTGVSARLRYGNAYIIRE